MSSKFSISVKDIRAIKKAEVLLGYFYEKLSNSNALLRDFLPKIL